MSTKAPSLSPQHTEELQELLKKPDWHLDEAALVIGKLEDHDLDINPYLHKLDCLGNALDRELPSKRDLNAVMQHLIKFITIENGFSGDEKSYFSPENSYLHRVIERRKGIPITLSLVYIEVGRRIGVPIVGIGMPGHFLIQLEGKADVYLDPFYGGEILSESGCQSRFRRIYGERAYFDKRFLKPLDKSQIIARLINNLKGIFIRKGNPRKTVELIDLYLTINPNATYELLERGLLYKELECFKLALRDFEAYLTSLPAESSNPDERQKVTEEIVALKRLTSNFH